MKATLVATGAALLLLAAPAQTLEPAAMLTGWDLEGNQVTLPLDPSLDHSARCDAPAPCYTGQHAGGFGLVLFGFAPGPLRTGVYHTVLVHESHATTTPPKVVTLTCHATPATPGMACHGPGFSTGPNFHHACAFEAADGYCWLLHF